MHATEELDESPKQRRPHKQNIRKKSKDRVQEPERKEKLYPPKTQEKRRCEEDKETVNSLNMTLITKLLHCSCLAVEEEGENSFLDCCMNINIDGVIKVNLGFSRETSADTPLPFKAEVHVEKSHKSLQSVHHEYSIDQIFLAMCLLR